MTPGMPSNPKRAGWPGSSLKGIVMALNNRGRLLQIAYLLLAFTGVLVALLFIGA